VGSYNEVLFLTDFGGFDQIPEFWILLQRLILLNLQPGTKQEILQRMAIQGAMDKQTQFVALEIDPIIADAEPMQNPARPLELAEIIHLGMHDLLGQSAEFAQDL